MRWLPSLLFSLSMIPVFAQDEKPVASVTEFTPSLGFLKGTLTYLDYSSGKPFTMPVNARIRVTTGKLNGIILALDYPQEPKANGNDTLVISKEGTLLNGAKLVSKRKLADGSLELIADKEGRDGNDNKKALLRHIYTISKTKFNNRKEVKFEGTDVWILRNEYLLGR